MSTLTSLISAGGGGGTPVNTIAQLNVGGQTLYTDPSGGEWLKAGNVLTSGLASYPDAKVKKRPLMSSLSYDGVTATLSYNAGGFEFNPDGTRLYWKNYSSNLLYQYNLSTPWDLSTISYSGKSFNLLNFGTAPIWTLSVDGKYLYGSSNTSRINVFRLDTPYELNSPTTSVATSVSIQYPQFSFASTGTSTVSNFGITTSMVASYCGNYLYVTMSSGMILQLRVPNGGDFSSANTVYMYAEGYTGLGAFSNSAKMMFIDSIAENIIVANPQFNSKIQLHSMSANNISTARFVAEVTDTTLTGQGRTFYLKPDYTKLYMSEEGQPTLYQFSITPQEYIGIPGSANPSEYIKIK